MANSIRRSDFVNQLAGGDGTLNVNDLSPALEKRLEAAGVSHDDLVRIAGKDAQLRGTKEMTALFNLLDGLDARKDDTLTLKARTPDGSLEATVTGEAVEALQQEVEKRRQSSHEQGIVHLGMRAPSTAEVRALKEATGSKGQVYSIPAYAVSDGKVTIGGDRFDLGTPAGRDQFRQAVIAKGVPAARAQEFVDLLERANGPARDELALLGLSLHEIGAGTRKVNRMVFSGHGSGDELVGDRSGERISHETLKQLAQLFPAGAAKIEHLAMSSCFCAKDTELDVFREAFPNLKSWWGYNGMSPKAESAAPHHLRDWATKTDGDDPSAVDPRGVNAASWNVVDEKQNFPSKTLAEAEQALADAEPVWRAYRNGTRALPPGGHDAELDRFYFRIHDALAAPGLPPARRAELNQLRLEVLYTRHPEMRP
jgi:hypothetical protein